MSQEIVATRGVDSVPRTVVARVSRLVALLCIVATAISLFARHWWLADLIANLRIQLIIGLVIASAGLVMSRQRRLGACVTLALIWHCSWIVPYLWAPPKPWGTHALKICTANVLTQNMQHDKVLAVLKGADADVIAVLELSTSLESRLNQELSDRYPYRITQPDDGGNFGMGLWSKLPLQDAEVFHLTVPLVPSISAKVIWDGVPVQLIATHPIPPVNSRYFQARNKHLELLSKRIQSAAAKPQSSTVLVGDLNLTPWSPWYQKFLADAELEDCVRGDRMASLNPTWYRWPLFPFGLLLDHGFCGDGLSCTSRKVLEDIGSDHRPVLLEFVYAQDFSVQEVENLRKK